MAMHIIIDGYNVLGVRGRVGGAFSHEGEENRERLIQELSRYQHRKGHHVTVVFDAWRARNPEYREHRSGVHVIYTKAGERADQVIQRMARTFGRECVVVSSDFEIKATAKDHGALTLGAQEFQRKLQAVLNPGKSAGRVENALRDPAYEKVEDEPFAERPDKKGNPRKLPKSRRIRNRQLKGF